MVKHLSCDIYIDLQGSCIVTQLQQSQICNLIHKSSHCHCHILYSFLDDYLNTCRPPILVTVMRGTIISACTVKVMQTLAQPIQPCAISYYSRQEDYAFGRVVFCFLFGFFFVFQSVC